MHHAHLLGGFCVLYCVRSNARARETVCDYGGPSLAETDGPGGPLVAGTIYFVTGLSALEVMHSQLPACTTTWYKKTCDNQQKD